MKGFPTSEKPFVVRLPKKENIWPFLSLCCCGFGFFFYVSFLGNSIIILLNKKEEKTKINIGTFFSLWYFSSVGSPPCSFSLPKLWWCNDAVGRLEWQAEECQCCYHSRWVGCCCHFRNSNFFSARTISHPAQLGWREDSNVCNHHLERGVMAR